MLLSQKAIFALNFEGLEICQSALTEIASYLSAIPNELPALPS
jgi:hypothetical protein